MLCRAARAHSGRDGSPLPIFGSASSASLLSEWDSGVFIAPNNHATINAVPANLSGVAGAMLNLTRILGTVAGVASASAVLSWQLQVARGSTERRLAAFSPHHFVEAVAGRPHHACGLRCDRRRRFVDPASLRVSIISWRTCGLTVARSLCYKPSNLGGPPHETR